jgi:hypothetical protein
MAENISYYNAVKNFYEASDKKRSVWDPDSMIIWDNVDEAVKDATQLNDKVILEKPIFSSERYVNRIKTYEAAIDAGYSDLFDTYVNKKGTISKMTAARKNTYTPILELMFATGARVGDINAIQMKDINWEKKYIKLENPKFGIKRVIPISDHLLPILKKAAKHPGGGMKSGTEMLFHKGGNFAEAVSEVDIGNYIKDVSRMTPTNSAGKLNPFADLVDESFFDTAVMDEEIYKATGSKKAATNKVTHSYRRAKTVIMEKYGFDPDLINKMFGWQSTDNKQRGHYGLAGRLPESAQIEISPRLKSAITADIRFSAMMKAIEAGYRTHEGTIETARKNKLKIEKDKLTTQADILSGQDFNSKLDATKDTISNLRKELSTIKKRGLSSGLTILRNADPSQFDEKVLPGFYEDLRTEGTDVDIPETDRDAIYTNRQNKINRLSTEDRIFAQHNLDDDIKEFVKKMDELEFNSPQKVKYNLPIEDGASQIIDEVLNSFNMESYTDEVSKNIEELKLASANWSYNLDDTFDFEKTARKDAFKYGFRPDDVKDLTTFYGGAVDLVDPSTPVAKLNPQILDELLDMIELDTRAKGIADTVIDQLLYLDFNHLPTQDQKVAKLYNAAYTAIEDYIEKNPEAAIGFDRKQGTVPRFLEDFVKPYLKAHIWGQEYATIRGARLEEIMYKNIVSNLPEATIKKYGVDNALAIAFEPYKQFLAKHGVIDSNVWLNNRQKVNIHTPFKDNYNWNRDGSLSKIQKQGANILSLDITWNNTNVLSAFPEESAQHFVDGKGGSHTLKTSFVNLIDLGSQGQEGTGGPVKTSLPINPESVTSTDTMQQQIDRIKSGLKKGIYNIPKKFGLGITIPPIAATFWDAITHTANAATNLPVFKTLKSGKALTSIKEWGPDVLLESVLFDQAIYNGLTTHKTTKYDFEKNKFITDTEDLFTINIGGRALKIVQTEKGQKAELMNLTPEEFVELYKNKDELIKENIAIRSGEVGGLESARAAAKIGPTGGASFIGKDDTGEDVEKRDAKIETQKEAVGPYVAEQTARAIDNFLPDLKEQAESQSEQKSVEELLAESKNPDSMVNKWLLGQSLIADPTQTIVAEGNRKVGEQKRGMANEIERLLAESNETEETEEEEEFPNNEDFLTTTEGGQNAVNG